MANTPDSREIAITRFYDAPVQLVWDAWTDPKQVAQWWGPRGFTLTTHSKDLRPGGSWVYTMHRPDGIDYPNGTRYIEVEPGRRLVYDHGANDDRPALSTSSPRPPASAPGTRHGDLCARRRRAW